MRCMRACDAAAARASFLRRGFVVLEPWLTAAELAALRAECDSVVAAAAHRSDAADGAWVARERGCVFELPGAGGAAACDAHAFRARRSAAACGVLFGAPLRELAAALLREEGDCEDTAAASSLLPLCLCNEQFIVKPPHSGADAAFAWHRDAQWCPLPHAEVADARSPLPRPRYVSVWVALDDMSEENGTLYILPGSHQPAAPGAPLPPPPPRGCGEDGEGGTYVATVAAGAAVVLSDAVLHCSGRNLSAHPRRAWMPQLAAAPLLRADGAPIALAVPLLPPLPPEAAAAVRKRSRAAGVDADAA